MIRVLAHALMPLVVITLSCGDDDSRDPVGSAGGSGTRGGEAGSGGSSVGEAGSGGSSVGEAGSGGSSAGTGDLGGASGTPGSAGEGTSGPPNCWGASFANEQDIERATVALMSCTSDDGFFRTPTYLRRVQDGVSYGFGDSVLACLAAITNGCDGVLGCLGLTPGTPATCDVCSGNVASFCGTDLEGEWDCSALGATCVDGQCVPEGSATCDVSTFTPGCDAEGRPTTCDDFEQSGPPCPALGLACNPEPANLACEGTGAVCTTDSYPFAVAYTGSSCSGDTLSACVNGREAELDCACFGPGFSCQSADGAFFCGSDGECDPATFAKTCNGDSVVFCNAGRIVEVACSSLGFSGCSDSASAGCTI